MEEVKKTAGNEGIFRRFQRALFLVTYLLLLPTGIIFHLPQCLLFTQVGLPAVLDALLFALKVALKFAQKTPSAFSVSRHPHLNAQPQKWSLECILLWPWGSLLVTEELRVMVS